jgi:hypothetical protein
MAENKEPQEPSLYLNQEEASLLEEGLKALPPERKKTVVFERLGMKVNKVVQYWQTLEKARELKKKQLAKSLLEKKPNGEG